MRNRVFALAGLGVVLVVAGVLVAGNKAGSKKADHAAQGVRAQAGEPEPLVPVSSRVGEGGAPLPEGADAAEVYGALMKEIEALWRAAQAGSVEEQMRTAREVEDKLVSFRNAHSDAPEALDAAFQLGTLNYSLQEMDKSAKYLSEFVAKAGESQRDKVAYAHFYLGDAYRFGGKYDDAAAEFKIVTDRYGDVNPALTQRAQITLQGLGTDRLLAVGSEPLAFSVKGLKGETLSPADFRGKVLLLDFWATWCKPCLAEMPNVKQVYKKYHDKGFEIVGISLDRSRENLDSYLKTQAIEWPQHFDGKFWGNEVAVKYGIQSIPTTFLIDRQGKIRYRSLRGKQLELMVEKLLNEKS